MHGKIKHEQEILCRSLLFRLYAVLKVTYKTGAKTQGSDRVILKTTTTTTTTTIEEKLAMVEIIRTLLTPTYKTQTIRRVEFTVLKLRVLLDL
jgi:hypothetical protein